MAVRKTIATPCPKCGKEVVVKNTKNKKVFYGCSGYPDCDFISWDMPIEEKCEECGSYMVEKKSAKGNIKKCSNDECATNKKKGKKDES